MGRTPLRACRFSPERSASSSAVAGPPPSSASNRCTSSAAATVGIQLADSHTFHTTRSSQTGSSTLFAATRPSK